MRYDHAFRDPGYHSAFLTTFDLTPTVFEDVALVHLVGAGCRNIAVLGDTRMFNRTFHEVGAPHQAGTRYHLAKRTVAGAFHPKIVVQLGETKGRLMVSSANLTGAGLMGNLETVAVHTVSLEETGPARLIAAALDYFTGHVDPSDRAMARALLRARARTPWLDNVTAARELTASDGQRHAFATENTEAGVADTLLSFIDGDRIQRLVVVSPFWDAGLQAVSRLQDAMGGPETALVVDPFEQDFGPEAFRRLVRTTLHSSQALNGAKPRRLHAKLIIACGERSDYVLAGSANASLAGLFGRSERFGNAEACLIRTEPPGTALDRLRLTACLAEPMLLRDLCPRREDAGAAEEGTRLRDGGALSVDQGELQWLPPPNCDPARCAIQIETVNGQLLALEAPLRVDGRWLATISLPQDAQVLGRILFEDGSESVLLPIARLTALLRNTVPTASSRDYALLEQFLLMTDYNADALDIAMQLAAMQDPPEPGPVVRPLRHESRLKEVNSRTMSEEEFLRVDEVDRRVLDELAGFGPLGEMHRRISSVLGLSLTGLDVERPFEVAETEDDLLTSGTDSGLAPDGYNDSDEVAIARQDGSTSIWNEGPHVGTAVQSPSATVIRSPLPRGSADLLASRLQIHVGRFCRSIQDPSQDPFSMRNALLVTLLIMAHLDVAAAPWDQPTEWHPLAADAPTGGWVRQLGRMLQCHRDEWKRSEALNGELDPSRLNALGTLVHASSLVREVAVAAGMRRPVIEPLANVSADMARFAMSRVAADPAKSRRLEEVMARCDVRYARLRIRATAAA